MCKLNEKYLGELFKHETTLSLLGTKFDIFMLRSIELYDPTNLIKDCGQRPSDIFNLVDVKNKYTIQVEAKDNVRQYSKSVVDELGLYQIFMSINNPRANKFRANIANNLTRFREVLGMDLGSFVDRLEHNILQTDCKAVFNRIHTLPIEISKMLEDLINEKILVINNAYTLPVYEGDIIVNELRNTDYIKNINKVENVTVIRYFIEYENTIKSLSKVFNVTDKFLIEELGRNEIYSSMPELITKVYFNSEDIYDYINKQLEENKLGIKGTVEELYESFINNIIDNKGLSRILTVSLSKYINVNKSYSRDVYYQFREKVDEYLNMGYNYQDAIKETKKDMKDNYL